MVASKKSVVPQPKLLLRALGFGRTLLFLSLWGLVPPSAAEDLPEELAKPEPAHAEEAWFERQVRTFRLYRHLDRAQRWLTDGRLEDAQQEASIYLKKYPDDDKMQRFYVSILQQAGKHKELINFVDPLLQRSPNSSQLWIYRGMANHALQRDDIALGDFRKVAEAPASIDADRRLALNMVADLALQNAKLDLALATLDKLQSLDPGFQTAFRRGLVFERLRQLHDAETSFDNAARLASDKTQRIRALLAKGEVAATQKNWDAAQAAYEQALQLYPKNKAALRRRIAEFNQQKGDRRNALQWAKLAATMEPTLANKTYLAKLLASYGNHSGAIEQFEQILKLPESGPIQYETQMALGYEYSATKQYQQAESAFASAAKTRPLSDAYLALLQVQQTMGRTDEARKTLRRLTSLGLTSDVAFRRAILEAEAGNYSIAETIFEQAINARLPQQLERDAYLRLAQIYRIQGKYDDAEAAYQRLLKLGVKTDELYRDLANLATQRGHHAEAVKYFKATLSSHVSTYSLRGLAYAATNLKDIATATSSWQRLLQQKGLTPKERGEALVNLGALYSSADRAADAIRVLTEARSLPVDAASVDREIGNLYARQQQWQEAVPHFETALAQLGDDVQLMAMLAHAHTALNHADEAIKYWERALAMADKMTAEERRLAYVQISYLFALKSDAERTADYAARALKIKFDPIIALRLAHALRRLGKHPEALAALESIPPGSLPANLDAERQDEIAVLYANDRNFTSAITAESKALQESATPARHYQLGIYDRERNQMASALSHMEQALAGDSTNTLYAWTLAYAYGAAGRDDDELAVLERLKSMDAVNPNLASEMGYLHLRNGRTTQAAEAFRDALYRYRLTPNVNDSESHVAADRFRLRQEVARLTNHWDLTLYESFRSGTGRVGTIASNLSGGVVPSQGGIEISYQPPVIGLVKDRVLQVFTRLLWANEPDSLSIDDRTVQGGFGVRYKPLSEYNLYASVERLYPVGKQALDGWLLRSTYGWANGADLQFESASRNYTYAYADLGYFAGQSSFLGFYGEYRQGFSSQLWDRLLFAPHAVLDGRIQTNDDARVSYLEGGLGLLIRLYFNATEEEHYRSSFDLILQYKWGLYNVQDSFILTGGLRF